MRTFLVRLGRAAAVCALLTGGGIAHADEPSPAISPPRLTRFVPANDPRESGGAIPQAIVELELDIDREGAVKTAKVVRSGGDALDNAAVTAAKAFVFEPALRDGKPVPVRIRYEYVFAAREPVAPPPPPPESRPAAISGVALDRDSGKPIANANVVVTTDAGATYSAKTDSSGAFRIEGIAPGPVHVVISADKHVPSRLDETLEPGTITEAKLRLEETPDPEAFVATARVEAPPREVTKRSLSSEEMKRIPGTRGDPIRAVELLPGSTRPALGDGLPILRGAKGQDSQVFADGAPVPVLYHLGGLTSFAHSRVIDTVDVYPSNFGVRYGRKIGGVIDVRFRDPRTDRFHAIGDISLLDSSLVLETPIGEKFSVMAAARRSNIDAVLNAAASNADIGITTAPVYWDYQAVAAYKPTDNDRFRLIAYGSSDSLKVLIKKPADGDPAVRGTFGGKTTFHRAQLGWRHRFGGGSEQNTELTYGHQVSDGTFGDFVKFEFKTHTLQGRSEWTAVLSPAVRLIAGADVLGEGLTGDYSGLAPTSGEGDQPMTITGQRRVRVEPRTIWLWQPGGYIEAGIRPVPNLLITPGVRVDYNDQIKRGAIDPRISARWDITDMTAIKAGVGHFSQGPQVPEALVPIGNPDLKMMTALHTSAGVEQKLSDSVSLGVEGFAKWTDGIITNTPEGTAPYFLNSQKGRIFGGEFLARVKPSGRFFGFLSYTLMRSERRDAGQDWRLFDRDQPHTLAAAGVYRLGRGWEIGATFRFSSGTPYTPVVGSTYDGSNDIYQARLGKTMSARNPAFNRLDVRIEKKWTFSLWSLAVYLDVQNALNSPNREGFSYSYDYRNRLGTRGFPIFPALGIRGEL